MAELSIRPAVPEDAGAVERLRLAGWRTAYRGTIPGSYLDAMTADTERRRAQLASVPDGVLTRVAVTGGGETGGGPVVGWASAGPCRDADRPGSWQGEVYACYVHPDWWRRGAGRLLMRDALSGLVASGRPDVTLWVLEANDRARRFYATLGFGPDGTRKLGDFGRPVPEVRYWRPGPNPRA